MYNQRINYVIVGSFAVAMLVAAAVSLALITGRTGPTDPYYLVLDNVADVKFGTQVRYEGFPVGQVEAITPVPKGARMRFRVDVTVAQGWRIPADSLARIGASSFLAAKTIDIASGAGPRVLAPGGKIPSAPPSDIFTTIAATAGEISELNRTSIKPLLATLNELAGALASGAPRVTDELVAFSRRLNDTIAPVQDFLAEDNLAAVERTVGNVEEMSDSFARLGRDLKTTLAKVDNLAGNLDRLVADNKGDVDRSLKDLQYTAAAVSRTVDSIVHNLEGTARNMNEFSRLIRQNPGLLLDGSPREAVSPARAGAADPRGRDGFGG